MRPYPSATPHADIIQLARVNSARDPKTPRCDSFWLDWPKLLVFLAFFPYPAILQVGASTGIQLGQALCIVVFIVRLPAALASRSWVAFLLLCLPMMASFSMLTILGRLSNPALATKALLSSVFVLLALPAFGSLLSKRASGWMATPVAVAILVHVALAIHQSVVFHTGIFPFSGLYRNPSFADLAGMAENYALYNGRPMGLFPEPSSLAASIGPWSIWLLQIGLSTPQWGRRALALIAGIGGIAAVLLGGSVYGAFILAAIPAVLLGSPLCKEVKWVTSVIVGVSLAVMTPFLLAPRVLGANASRDYRLESIREALKLPLADSVSLLMGRGVGQTGTLFHNLGSEFPATYSVLADRFVGEGLLALVGVAAIGWMVASRIRTIAWGAISVLLLVSLALTTSYLALLPMWLMLATLLDARLGEAAHTERRKPVHLSRSALAGAWDDGSSARSGCV